MSDENLIDALCDRIKFDKERLEKNELGRIEVETFSLPEFWTQFGAAVQALNNEVTKIGFNCGKKPFPGRGDMESMMRDLLQYYTVTRDLYMVLPQHVGAVLYKAVSSAVIGVMASLIDFVKSLHNLTDKGAKERLTLTGAFWDACNAVDSLPKDNLQATLKVVESEVHLASDAQEELETVEQGNKVGLPWKSEFHTKNSNAEICDPVGQKEVDMGSQRCAENLKKEQRAKENTVKSDFSKSKLIILTGTDFKNLEKWIRSQLHIGKTPNAENMQNEVSRIIHLIEKLKTNTNGLNVASMSESQIKEKCEKLNKILESYLAMKKIIDTEPEKFEEMVSNVNTCYTTKDLTNKISKIEDDSQMIALTLDKQGSKDNDELSDKSSTTIEDSAKCSKMLGIDLPKNHLTSEPPKLTTKNLSNAKDDKELAGSQKILYDNTTNSQSVEADSSTTMEEQQKEVAGESCPTKLHMKKDTDRSSTLPEMQLQGVEIDSSTSPEEGNVNEENLPKNKSSVLDQHLNVTKSNKSQTVHIIESQRQVPNKHSHKVNISMDLEYSNAVLSTQYSSGVSGRKRKMNPGNSKEQPLQKTPKTKFKTDIQTKVNVSLLSTLKTPSSNEEHFSGKNSAQLAVSITDGDETKVSHVVKNNTKTSSPVSWLIDQTTEKSVSTVRSTVYRQTNQFEQVNTHGQNNRATETHNSVKLSIKTPCVKTQVLNSATKLAGTLYTKENSCREKPHNTDEILEKSTINNKVVSSANLSNNSQKEKNSNVRTLQSDNFHIPTQKSEKLFDVLIHMFLPKPNTSNCSTAFVHYYPNLRITEALENIARRNPKLGCNDWVVHKEWWDEQQCYNTLIWIDDNSFRELEAQGLVARVTYKYYAMFRKVQTEPRNSLPISDSSHGSCLNKNLESLECLTPVVVHDYKHGLLDHQKTEDWKNCLQYSSGVRQPSAVLESDFRPVKVTDYQHGNSQTSDDGSSRYSPSQCTADTDDENTSHPNTQESQVLPPEVITDFTQTFF